MSSSLLRLYRFIALLALGFALYPMASDFIDIKGLMDSTASHIERFITTKLNSAIGF